MYQIKILEDVSNLSRPVINVKERVVADRDIYIPIHRNTKKKIIPKGTQGTLVNINYVNKLTPCAVTWDQPISEIHRVSHYDISKIE